MNITSKLYWWYRKRGNQITYSTKLNNNQKIIISNRTNYWMVLGESGGYQFSLPIAHNDDLFKLIEEIESWIGENKQLFDVLSENKTLTDIQSDYY